MNQINELVSTARREFPRAELLLVFLPDGGSAISCKPEDAEAFERYEFCGVALVTELGDDAVDVKCLIPRTNQTEQKFRHQIVRECAVAEHQLSRQGEGKN